MKIKYITPLVIIASLVVTPVFAATNPAPSKTVRPEVKEAADKARAEAKAVAEQAKENAKIAIEKAKAEARATAEKAKADAKTQADKVKADAKASKEQARATELAARKAEDKAKEDAYKKALADLKAQKAVIAKNFESAVKSARATLKVVKDSKPAKQTLADAWLAFDTAVSVAEKVKADALAQLPAAPVKPVHTEIERAPKVNPTPSASPTSSPIA